MCREGTYAPVGRKLSQDEREPSSVSGTGASSYIGLGKAISLTICSFFQNHFVPEKVRQGDISECITSFLTGIKYDTIGHYNWVRKIYPIPVTVGLSSSNTV